MDKRVKGQIFEIVQNILHYLRVSVRVRFRILFKITFVVYQSRADVSLASSCSNTGSIRDYVCWTSRDNCLELIELSGISKFSFI